MMPTLQPFQAIPTRYRGYHFRSRAEARWAVFFDAAGIKFEYEPEGIKFGDGTCYLPDFWLPEFQMWFEVKGRDPSNEEMKLCGKLAWETEYSVMLAIGAPDPDIRQIIFIDYQCGPHRIDSLDDHPVRFTLMDDRRDDDVYWLYSDDWGAFSIGGKGISTDHDRWPCIITQTERGYNAARSARFEYGESGAT